MGSSVLALGPNQLGSGGRVVKARVPLRGASLEASHPPVETQPSAHVLPVLSPIPRNAEEKTDMRHSRRTSRDTDRWAIRGGEVGQTLAGIGSGEVPSVCVAVLTAAVPLSPLRPFLSINHAVEAPAVGHAFEFALTGVFEDEA